MKILIEFDSLTNDARVVSKSTPTKKDIIKECCQYCQVTYEDLIKLPLIKKEEYVICRCMILLFMDQIFHLTRKELTDILNYTEASSAGIALTASHKRMIEKDIKLSRPYYNLCKILGVIPDNF
jgi:hypothetical protein